jgi:prepilin peptidase CpaA
MTTLEQTFIKATLAIALLALLALAVRQDLREHRISNALMLAGFLGALVLQTLLDGAQGLAGSLAGAGIGLLCFLPLYFSKGIGAGDVKLMAAAGAFFGPADAFIAALLSLAAGAVLAVIVVAWRAL